MHVSRVFISNYKSIDKLDLEFKEGKNVVVGKNNSGKSNIIKAIDLVLGESSPDYHKSANITENDFHKGDVSRDIIILICLSRAAGEALNYEEINKCWGYHILGSCQWIYSQDEGKKVPNNIVPVRVPLSKDDNDQLLLDVKSIFEINFDDADTVYINPKLKNQQPFKGQLEDKYQFAYLFFATYDSEHKIVKKDLRFLYRESDDKDWVLASKASIRNEILQSAIIPAFRDPQNQLRANNYTWYGKLLQSYIDNDNRKLKNAFEKVRIASSEIFGELEKKISDNHVQIAFPDTKITFQFNPDTKQEVYKSALIYVDDGFNSLLEDKGSGIQSAVIIGLFDFYVRNISHVSSSLLAIEEPELYLHPHGRRVISNRLEDFLEDGKNQVIVTTHSSEFITSTEKDLHIILVRKLSGKTTAYSTFFKNPKDKRLLLKGQNTEMFFADSVILVEGAEKYILDVVARKYGRDRENLDEDWLDNKNISTIAVSGKTEFLKYSNKLDELHIVWVVFADFDFIRRGLCEFLTGKSVDQSLVDRVNALKSEISQQVSNQSYKKLSEIPKSLHREVKNLISDLKSHNIFVFSGELEDLYTATANSLCCGLGKEEKAICIASEITPENESDYVQMDEYNEAFSFFLNIIQVEDNPVNDTGVSIVHNAEETENVGNTSGEENPIEDDIPF